MQELPKSASVISTPAVHPVPAWRQLINKDTLSPPLLIRCVTTPDDQMDYNWLYTVASKDQGRLGEFARRAIEMDNGVHAPR